MEQFGYIMVTSWYNHWNNLRDNRTFYTKNMLKRGMGETKIKENTQTIFIRQNKQSKKAEKAWKGSVYDFKVEDTKISFKVKIEKEIQVLPEYSDYKEGWYIEEIGVKEEVLAEGINYPPFFNILKTTNLWQDFEDYTFRLLKLLGIHEIYRYEKQRGTADGFFKFKNLVVIYDCTLESDFSKSKESQIYNYCAQLKTGTMKHQERVINTSNYHKQVWIITRGTARIIKKVDDVVVKEVPVNNIIRIYQNRLENNIDEDLLENQLRGI